MELTKELSEGILAHMRDIQICVRDHLGWRIPMYAASHKAFCKYIQICARAQGITLGGGYLCMLPLTKDFANICKYVQELKASPWVEDTSPGADKGAQ